MDSTQPEFWDQRYRDDRLPWDTRGVPLALADYLRSAPAAGRVLIPGCGSGYEVRAFHEAGWDILAIDFAPSAVARAKELLGELGTRVRPADFFTDDIGIGYDVIYERTFLCSLPPSRWEDYVRRTAKLLRPGGALTGIFFYGEDPEPPPFSLTPATARMLLGGKFELTNDQPIPPAQSLPLYVSGERWQVWRRRELSSAETAQ